MTSFHTILIEACCALHTMTYRCFPVDLYLAYVPLPLARRLYFSSVVIALSCCCGSTPLATCPTPQPPSLFDNTNCWPPHHQSAHRHRAMQPQQPTDLPDRWTQHQRRNRNKTTQFYSCTFCLERTVFQSADDLYDHAITAHSSEIPPEGEEEKRRVFRARFEADSQRRSGISSVPLSRSFSRLQFRSVTKVLPLC